MKTNFLTLRFFNKQKKKIARILCIIMVLQLLPNNLFALTGGPSQPEVQSFEPVGTSEMVDVSTGDFNYNIPLIDIGGYPINLSYHAGVEMDQEASWVGLGWNLSPGVINRNMRGIPDDFSGSNEGEEDKIKKTFSQKDNWTVYSNVGANASTEILGIEKGKFKIEASLGIKYNSFRGVGFEYGVRPSIAVGRTGESGYNAGLNFQYDSESGLNISGSTGADLVGEVDGTTTNVKAGFNIGMSYNSRSGMQALNYGISVTRAKNQFGLAISPSSSYSFGMQTYTPQISSERRNDGINLNMAFGSEFKGLFPNSRIGAGFSIDKISNEFKNGKEKLAYGYYYEHDRGTNTDVILDFNREKDGNFTLNNTNLPLTNHTYDIYATTGQGIGGSYRMFRGDIPFVHDDQTKNRGYSIALGAETGVGDIAKFGANVGATFNQNTTGVWGYDPINLAGNGLWDKLNFVSPENSSEPSYEAAYFKNASDWSFTSDFDNLRFNTKLIAPIVSGVRSNQGEYYIPEGYKPKTSTQKKYSAFISKNAKENVRKIREQRNSVFSSLTANEASIVGLDRTLKNYNSNNFVSNGRLNRTEISRNSYPGHHFSEITVTQPGGVRYVYGIPAYNTSQIEKSFNVSGRSYDCNKGQVTYSPGSDNTKSNSLGKDNMFQSTEIPGYAHSYFLTAYLSPDYVDLSNDGVTDDDLGTAVKFNYSKLNYSYRWRIPYEQNSSSFQEGQKSNLGDDIGSYTYGTKDLWYLQSLETKTQIAVFITSNREDGLGVLNENGGRDTSQRIKRLDKIVLYSKQDFLKHGLNAVPIKTVHFEYDYTLCPEVENNSETSGASPNPQSGKLTLRKVYFTYGTSNKGRTTSYEFNYSSFNPRYNLKGSDCWGNYKRNPFSSCGLDDSLNNGDFPYTLQDKTEADKNAGAWCLSEIVLPSGGKISIQYESDDYAYVQNKRAMQMFKIAGFGSSDNPENLGNSLYTRPSIGKRIHNDLIYVDLPQAITGSNQLSEFKRRYLENISQLQFTIFTDIDSRNHYEYVKAYAEVDLDGCGINGTGTQAWIKVKKVKIGDHANPNQQVGPLAKAAWNYARLRCDYLIYPFSNESVSNNPGSIKKFVNKMAQVSADFAPILRGFYKHLEDRVFAKTVNLSKSWVRLHSPYLNKLGGGHRVKKITVNDNWSTIGSENSVADDALYGTEYEYSIEQKNADGSVETISSGVASYEPLIGGDENPFRLPKAIRMDYALVPDNEYFIETPIGESFFPAAGVVYSKVKSKALGYTDVEKSGTGYTVSEYYTAKDFPVIIEETEMQKIQEKPDPIESIFKFKKYTGVAAAQGYKIELNDMHGKPKSQYQYDEYNALISGVMYQYQHIEKNGIMQLTNNVKAINSAGIVSTAELGVEVDMVNDARESNGEIWNFGLALNLDVFTILVAPVAIPVILPSAGKQQNEFHSIVTTKVVKRFGILEKTIAMKGGSTIETKNLLYDRSTGEVLLSATQNEFNDSTFQFTYPAHWAYDGMGQAYKNINLTFNNVQLYHDQILLPNGLDPEDYLFPGDECLMQAYRHDGGLIKQQIGFVYRGSGGNLNMIDERGNGLEYETGITNWTIKVIRSGRRNMASTPIGQVSTITNPISNNSLAFNQVVDASATEFKDQWQTHITYLPRLVCDTNKLGSDIINLLNCNKDSIRSIKELNFQGYTWSEYIDSFKVVPLIGSPLYFKSLPQTSTSFPGKHTLDYSHGCDSFFFLSKLDSQWHFFNIYDTDNIDKYRIETFVSYYYKKSWNACLGTCNTWFMNSIFKQEADSLCPEVEVSCSNVNLKMTTSENLIEFEFDYPCDTLPLPCPIKLEYGGSPIQSVIDIISYDFNIDGDEMYLTTVVEDICGDPDTLIMTVSRCGQIMKECEVLCYESSEQYVVNPYKSGLEGNWRPFKTYKYLENRNYNSGTVNTRKDGIYQAFEPFWSYHAPSSKFVETTNSKWVWASEITKYSPFGNELETKDALNRYQSELFGYYHTLPIAVANNCRYNQIAFDGFEDYNYEHEFFSNICENGHLNFKSAIDADAFIDTSISHSGWSSMKINAGNNIASTRPIVVPHNWNTSIDTTVSRKTTIFDDLGSFSPNEGKYLIGGWIKEDKASGVTGYSGGHIVVTLTDISNSNTSFNYYGSGRIIEGWQRVEGVFSVPVNTKSITITMMADSEDATWFDDLRVHAWDGNMKSYVYDSRTLRTMAVLDENNYTTFYEYDAEGSLIRVKKETEKGIITIQENRTHIFKKD